MANPQILAFGTLLKLSARPTPVPSPAPCGKDDVSAPAARLYLRPTPKKGREASALGSFAEVVLEHRVPTLQGRGGVLDPAETMPGEMGFRNLLQSRVLDRQTPRGTRSGLIWTRPCSAASLGAVVAPFRATPCLRVQRPLLPGPSGESPFGLLIPRQPPSSSAYVSPLCRRSGCISKAREHLAPKRPRQPDQRACRGQVSMAHMNKQTSVKPSLYSY